MKIAMLLFLGQMMVRDVIPFLVAILQGENHVDLKPNSV